jgi:hypothetical protein
MKLLTIFSLVQIVASGMLKATTVLTMGTNLLVSLELQTRLAAPVVEARLLSRKRSLLKIPAAATIRVTGLIAMVMIVVFMHKAATATILETLVLTIMALQPRKPVASAEVA